MMIKTSNKRALAFETVVKAAILLIVLAVVVFVFMKLMRGATCTAEDYLEMQSTDRDNDGVVDAVDQCCNKGGEVDSLGCPADAGSSDRVKCTPRGCTLGDDQNE